MENELRTAMHPVVKRILLHGVLTAGLLALIGAGFAQLATIWMAGHEPRPGAEVTEVANDPVSEKLTYRVPAMMALWGFLFVLVGELLIWRIRGKREAIQASKEANPQDDAEKLLNDLLAQAEAKMAAEAEENKSKDPQPPTE
jgi:hypothetical protein